MNETRYFTSNLQILYGISGYQWNISNSSQTSTRSRTKMGLWAFYVGIRVYLLFTNGNMLELTSGVPEAIVRYPPYYEGLSLFVGYKTWDRSYLIKKDEALIVKIWFKWDGDAFWTNLSTFISEALTEKLLGSNEWYVYYWIERYLISGKTQAKFYWGDSSVDSRIERINFTFPTVFIELTPNF